MSQEIEKEKKETEEKNQDEKNLESKNISVEDKLKETEEKLLRSLAEIENQRKRFEKEIKDAFDFGGFNFAKETLSILDNLDRAKKSIKDDQDLSKNKDFDKFLKNIEIIEKDLISIFEKNKITKLISINQKFDPNFHQAMLEVEDDKTEPGTVVQEIQPGYMFGDRLLRPSFVGVSKLKNKEKNEKSVKSEKK
tara:strand:- start:31 stop:612 length:582 start_codon:yes stop_codon:yes gene_type:complete